MPAVAALAADTDGTDGGGGSASDPAGASIDGESVARAEAKGLDPAAFLADNNSSAFFEALGDLLVPGPTYTNVNDFRAIVVDTQ
jgi:hydroxypyruvate reductase